MKYLLIVLIFMLGGCNLTPCIDVGQPGKSVHYDTIYDTVFVFADNIRELNELKLELQCLKDSVYILNSSVPWDVYDNARKIEKIKYYISITERNAKNKTFFYGWIKRTMTD